MSGWAAIGQMVAGVFQGSFGAQAMMEEAELQKQQGYLLAQEGERSAEIADLETEERAATQAVNYLKSGVRLEGSPLLVTAETRKRGREYSESIRKRTEMQYNLQRSKAKQTRHGARSYFLGSTIGGISSGMGNMGGSNG